MYDGVYIFYTGYYKYIIHRRPGKKLIYSGIQIIAEINHQYSLLTGWAKNNTITSGCTYYAHCANGVNLQYTYIIYTFILYTHNTERLASVSNIIFNKNIYIPTINIK